MILPTPSLIELPDINKPSCEDVLLAERAELMKRVAVWLKGWSCTTQAIPWARTFFLPLLFCNSSWAFQKAWPSCAVPPRTKRNKKSYFPFIWFSGWFPRCKRILVDRVAVGTVGVFPSSTTGCWRRPWLGKTLLPLVYLLWEINVLCLV